MTNEMIKLVDLDGNENEVELITYLISDDNMSNYVVYSKGETQGAEQDRIIYISKVYREDNKLKVSEIIDDNEWAAVLQLLKNIANAK